MRDAVSVTVSRSSTATEPSRMTSSPTDAFGWPAQLLISVCSEVTASRCWRQMVTATSRHSSAFRHMGWCWCRSTRDWPEPEIRAHPGGPCKPRVLLADRDAKQKTSQPTSNSCNLDTRPNTKRLLDPTQGDAARRSRRDENAVVATLFYTGGTTGTPEGGHPHAPQPRIQRHAQDRGVLPRCTAPVPRGGRDVPRGRRGAPLPQSA